MPAFDIRPNASQPEQFTNYSRGIDSTRNDALGKLFEGTADFFSQSVQNADAYNQRGIRDSIYKETDAINDEFGVGDATLFESPAGKQPLPAQLASSGENLDRLQAAYERGALKESHYWARMNSMVRQLRQKYPGYRTEIDEMVASTTGARPANALRNALFNEWDAAAKSESSLSKLEDWAVKQGRLPPDYYQRSKEGTPYSAVELQKYVAGKTREAAEREDRRASMSELAETDQLTVKQASRNFRVDTTQLVQSTLYDTTKAIGGNYASLSAEISKAQKAAAAGNPVDAVQLNNLRGSIGELKTAMLQNLQKELVTPWDEDPSHSYAALLTPEDSKAIIAEAMLPITILEEALSSENPWGVLKTVTAHIEAQRDQASREMLDTVPLMDNLQALQSMLGPEAMGIYMSLNPEIQDALTASLLANQRLEVMTKEGASIVQGFDEGDIKDMGPEFFNGLVDGWTNTIGELEKGTLPLEVVQKNVDYMFGPESIAILGRMDDASRFDYFKRVASPIVTNQMRKLRDMGDIESWDNYQQWVTRSFLTLFQSKVQTLQGASSSLFRPGMRITWDDTNAAFRLYDPMEGQAMSLGTVIGGLDSSTVNAALQDINTAIRVVKPVLEDNGGSPGPEVYELLRQMGFDPASQQDFLGMMMGAVGGVFGFAEDEEEPAAPQAQTQSPTNGEPSEEDVPLDENVQTQATPQDQGVVTQEAPAGML
jgi:hypothetical protein